MMVHSQFFTSDEAEPVAVENAGGKSTVLLVCEHASNTLPLRYGTLGLDPHVLASHIAWDPGALAVARHLSTSLDATLVHQRYSRLIYDCNRPPEATGAMPAASEIFAIPGNIDLSADERQARTQALYIPFHDTVRSLISARQARGQETVVVTIHSFTPVYNGQPRAVELGILHDEDSRFADAMLARAADAPLFKTERNEPYGPADGVTHTLVLHGLSNGLRNVMIEVRNDLIDDDIGQGVMADYLAGLLQQCLGG